jgi:hypothetical protein
MLKMSLNVLTQYEKAGKKIIIDPTMAAAVIIPISFEVK